MYTAICCKDVGPSSGYGVRTNTYRPPLADVVVVVVLVMMLNGTCMILLFLLLAQTD